MSSSSKSIESSPKKPGFLKLISPKKHERNSPSTTQSCSESKNIFIKGSSQISAESKKNLSQAQKETKIITKSESFQKKKNLFDSENVKNEKQVLKRIPSNSSVLIKNLKDHTLKTKNQSVKMRNLAYSENPDISDIECKLDKNIFTGLSYKNLKPKMLTSQKSSSSLEPELTNSSLQRLSDVSNDRHQKFEFSQIQSKFTSYNTLPSKKCKSTQESHYEEIWTATHRTSIPDNDMSSSLIIPSVKDKIKLFQSREENKSNSDSIKTKDLLQHSSGGISSKQEKERIVQEVKPKTNIIQTDIKENFNTHLSKTKIEITPSKFIYNKTEKENGIKYVPELKQSVNKSVVEIVQPDKSEPVKIMKDNLQINTDETSSCNLLNPIYCTSKDINHQQLFQKLITPTENANIKIIKENIKVSPKLTKSSPAKQEKYISPTDISSEPSLQKLRSKESSFFGKIFDCELESKKVKNSEKIEIHDTTCQSKISSSLSNINEKSMSKSMPDIIPRNESQNRISYSKQDGQEIRDCDLLRNWGIYTTFQKPSRNKHHHRKTFIPGYSSFLSDTRPKSDTFEMVEIEKPMRVSRIRNLSRSENRLSTVSNRNKIQRISHGSGENPYESMDGIKNLRRSKFSNNSNDDDLYESLHLADGKKFLSLPRRQISNIETNERGRSKISQRLLQACQNTFKIFLPKKRVVDLNSPHSSSQSQASSIKNVPLSITTKERNLPRLIKYSPKDEIPRKQVSNLKRRTQTPPPVEKIPTNVIKPLFDVPFSSFNPPRKRLHKHFIKLSDDYKPKKPPRTHDYDRLLELRKNMQSNTKDVIVQTEIDQTNSENIQKEDSDDELLFMESPFSNEGLKKSHSQSSMSLPDELLEEYKQVFDIHSRYVSHNRNLNNSKKMPSSSVNDKDQ